jgi:hypothetical protein
MEQEYMLMIEKLRSMLKSKKNFEEAKIFALEVHAITHTSKVSLCKTPTYFDGILQGLKESDYCIMPEPTDETIAWHLWHIARIEDLVGNILISEQSQIFDDSWSKKLNVSIKDTGNAMSDEEIFSLSREINKKELINYRNAVGIRTRKTIDSLSFNDLRKKASICNLDRLVDEGGLIKERSSMMLKEFWGRLTIMGMVLLPLTRHHMMHLPDSCRIKEYIRTNNL